MYSVTKPTKPQADLIRYFDGGPTPNTSVKSATYRVCLARGWIERCESFPYYKTTNEGRVALLPKAPNTEPATVARQRIGDEARAKVLRSHGWTVISPDGDTQ